MSLYGRECRHTRLDFPLHRPFKRRYQIHFEGVDCIEEIGIHCHSLLVHILYTMMSFLRQAEGFVCIPKTWYGSRKLNASSYWCISLRYFLERFALILAVMCQWEYRWEEEEECRSDLNSFIETFFAGRWYSGLDVVRAVSLNWILWSFTV